MRRIVPCALIIVTPLLAFGQAAPTSLTFDVASVKPSASGGGGAGGIRPEPTGLTGTNVTLLFCIRLAYGVQDDQVLGPNWLNDDRYDIVAKTANPVNQDQLRLMLRALLAERFRLVLHREERIRSVYMLEVGKNGPKLTESKGEGPGQTIADLGHLAFQGASMAALARRLSQQLHEPVSDLTGLKGIYDFTLEWQQDDSVPGPSLFTAVQEQLGLRLEAKKTPNEVLIVDHADRIPTPN